MNVQTTDHEWQLQNKMAHSSLRTLHLMYNFALQKIGYRFIRLF
jgi:hypothetical protein